MRVPRSSKSFSIATVLFILSSHVLVQAFPTNDSAGSIVVREDELPKELDPQLKKDTLPPGDAKDAVQHTGTSPSEVDYKDCPDYDPDQDLDESSSDSSKPASSRKNAPAPKQEKPSKSRVEPAKGSSTSHIPRPGTHTRHQVFESRQHARDIVHDPPQKAVQRLDSSSPSKQGKPAQSKTTSPPGSATGGPGVNRDSTSTGEGKGAVESGQKQAISRKPAQEIDPHATKNGKVQPSIKAARSGTTRVLRSIRFNRKGVREGFLAFDMRKFVGIKGEFKKDQPVTTFETSEELPPKKNPKPGEELKKWEADHVHDLGYHTTIAKEDKPENSDISEKAWSAIQDAVFGVGQKNEEKPTEDTRVLGRILNKPVNLRGISWEMNAVKNQILRKSYANKELDFKKWKRSPVWAVYRYMIESKEQFDEEKSRLTKAYAGFIKDDKKSAKAVERHFDDKIDILYKRAVTMLEKVLENPPPEDVKDSPFKEDDCNNTKDTKNPPDSSQSSQPPPPPLQPTTPTVNPVIPPSAPTCAPVPAGHYKDAHETVEKHAARWFCDKYANDMAQGPSVNIAQTYFPSAVQAHRSHNDREDDNYDFKITSVDQCSMPGGLNLAEPVSGSKCQDIMISAWKDCNDAGRGGEITAGCLRYSVHPEY